MPRRRTPTTSSLPAAMPAALLSPIRARLMPTLIGYLAGTEITDPPAINTQNLAIGYIRLTPLAIGGNSGTPGGVREVQVIPFPSAVTGGSWSINGFSLDYNAHADAVATYI